MNELRNPHTLPEHVEGPGTKQNKLGGHALQEAFRIRSGVAVVGSRVVPTGQPLVEALALHQDSSGAKAARVELLLPPPCTAFTVGFAPGAGPSVPNRS